MLAGPGHESTLTYLKLSHTFVRLKIPRSAPPSGLAVKTYAT